MKRIIIVPVALALVAGCVTPGNQPAKSQTLTMRDCNINIYLPASTNEAHVASIEIGTQAQAVESSGTETYSPTSTPTQTISPSATLSPTSTGSGVASIIGGAVGGLVEGMQSAQSTASATTATETASE